MLGRNPVEPVRSFDSHPSGALGCELDVSRLSIFIGGRTHCGGQ